MEEDSVISLMSLRKEIFSEPTTSFKKDAILAYVGELAKKAAHLSEDERRGPVGHGIAMDIAGALAFQGAQGVQGEDWITEEAEPLLYELLSITGRLDASPANQEDWLRLFELCEIQPTSY